MYFCIFIHITKPAMHLSSQLWTLPAHAGFAEKRTTWYIFLPLVVDFLTDFEIRFVPVQGKNLEHYNISEFVSDLQHLKEQLSLCQNWDSATQWLILVVANWHTKSLWITSHFIFPTTNPLRGVWQKQWHDRKDNSHRAFFLGAGIFSACFVFHRIPNLNHGKKVYGHCVSFLCLIATQAESFHPSLFR